MRFYRLLIIPVLIASVFLVYESCFIVSEIDQVLLTQFGRPIGEPITEPGAHFKVPFIQKIHYLDKRWLEWDGGAAEMPTREKTYIWVDTYARWRIKDPLKFYTSVQTEKAAQSRLSDIIESETRNVIAAHDLIEVVRSSNRPLKPLEDLEGDMQTGTPDVPTEIKAGRTKLAELVRYKAAQATPDLGIELVDVQFQRVVYTESVSKKIYERMIAERTRIAQKYRSEGEGESAEIRGRKEKDLRVIDSEAYRGVQDIKGSADAKAAAVYAEAYSRDAKLYHLVKSLESYKTTVNKDTTLILSTDAEHLKSLVSPE